MTLFTLQGKRGLVVGIANEHSIAYGCAKAFREMGADLAVTYLNAKAEPYVRPLAERLGADIIMPCDLRKPGELEAVFDAIHERWGRLDFLLHSVAFAPRDDLHARVVDCSAEGFAACHGRFLPFVHPHGEAGRAADDRGRLPDDGHLLRRRKRWSSITT